MKIEHNAFEISVIAKWPSKRALHSDIATITCPHECSVPGCPGNRNRLRLELFDEMLAACKGAAWLYDEMALGPLEAAAKYGPDYEPPTDAECLKVRGDLGTVIAKAKELK